MKNKIAICILIYIIGVFTPIAFNKIKTETLENRVIYKIKIKADYINLREEVSLSSNVIMQVYKDEEFEVVKYYEGNIYNWYNIIYEDGKTGWIASGKDEPWVIIEY